MAQRRLTMTEAGRGQIHANVQPGQEFECSEAEAAVHLALGHATETRPDRPYYATMAPRPRGRPPRIPRVEESQEPAPRIPPPPLPPRPLQPAVPRPVAQAQPRPQPEAEQPPVAPEPAPQSEPSPEPALEAGHPYRGPAPDGIVAAQEEAGKAEGNYERRDLRAKE